MRLAFPSIVKKFDRINSCYFISMTIARKFDLLLFIFFQLVPIHWIHPRSVQSAGVIVGTGIVTKVHVMVNIAPDNH